MHRQPKTPETLEYGIRRRLTISTSAGLSPEPMVAILRLLDSGGAGSTVIAHLDREPIFLYPELDERGWSHEIVPGGSGGSDSEDEVVVRLVRRGV